jgi:hypothetical protein
MPGVKRLDAFEVWNTTTWTLAGARSDEDDAQRLLAWAKRQDKRSTFVILKRQRDGTLADAHPTKHPTSDPVWKQLEALEMPKLPGWEKL